MQRDTNCCTSFSFFVLVIVVVSLGLAGCATDSTWEERVEIDHDKLTIFGPISHVVESAENPVTPEKVKLGRMFWYEQRMSEDAGFPKLEREEA